MRALLNLFLGMILLHLFTTGAMACTIAVVSGSATIDGRPLLWKNRDVNDHNQEVRYFNDGSFGGYLALVTTGDNETTTSYVGLNEAGLAIMNSVSPDLLSGYPSSHGIFMKRALRECGTVADFEALLNSTSGSRGNIWANFGVIDALGEAAIFEATNTDYVRYDAVDHDGFVVRANNSIWGGGDLGSRYYAAQQLVSDGAVAGELSHEFFIQTVAPDLGDTPSMPCGQWPAEAPALNRHQTRSSVVVHGVLPSEDSRLSTFWCTLGEPICGVSVPLWACAGTPPVIMGDPGNQSAMCGAIQEKENYCYSNLSTDTTIDTEALVGTDGTGGIHAYSLPIEAGSFEETEIQLASWRQLFPLVEDVIQFQLQHSNKSFLYYNQENYPDEALLAVSQAVPGPINCSGASVLNFNLTTDLETPDVFLYNIEVQASAEVSFASVFDLLPFTDDNENFFAVNNGGGSWTITGSTIADPNHTHPIVEPGTVGLFSIEFSAVAEGLASITFGEITFRDPSNQNITCSASGTTFTVDCTAPLAVTSITANPHHNRIEVSWDHDDNDVDYYEIYRGLWHVADINITAYPEFDDNPDFAVPAHPASGLPLSTEGWVRADDGTHNFAVDSFFDIFTQVEGDLQRGACSYEVYAVDAAGNVSDPATNNAAATNYWLGDMTPVSLSPYMADGLVTASLDMTYLGASFGTADGEAGYNSYCDVGPTDNFSAMGIPITDSVINFEDLMVFSMNFGIVSETNKSEESISTIAQLSWVEAGQGQYVLRLIDGVGIKGVHVSAPKTINSVMAGQFLDDQSELTFLKNVGGSLDVSISVMGQGRGFAGAGDLLVVNSQDSIDFSDLNIELRGHDNSVVQVSLSQTIGLITPRVFNLGSAFPNPFNPVTKISFSLPGSQDVHLSVYGVDGKLVRTLVNETCGAGLHEVIWNGQDDSGQLQASGLYFYRIEAGPYSQVRKMSLVK